MTEATGRITDTVLAAAARIRLAVFDVDGVLTDGRILLAEDGTEAKTFASHDGLGLRWLHTSGIAVAVITARESRLVARRAQELGMDHVWQGRADKGAALTELAGATDVALTDCAYVGDDVVDLPAMRTAGLGVAVANATPMTRAYADYTTLAAGGAGAAREVAELLLAAQGRLDDCLDHYLQPVSAGSENP